MILKNSLIVLAKNLQLLRKIKPKKISSMALKRKLRSLMINIGFLLRSKALPVLIVNLCAFGGLPMSLVAGSLILFIGKLPRS